MFCAIFTEVAETMECSRRQDSNWREGESEGASGESSICNLAAATTDTSSGLVRGPHDFESPSGSEVRGLESFHLYTVES